MLNTLGVTAMTEEHPPTTTTEVPDEIADEPPAAKLVYLLVERNAPTTFGALQSAAGLSATTARTHLDTLVAQGLVVETMHSSDARRSIYRIT